MLQYTSCHVHTVVISCVSVKVRHTSMPKCINPNQVKIRISHHAIKKNDATVTPTKDLVFVLDDVSSKPPKKRKKTGRGNKDQDTTGGVTVKNFGANLLIPKLKASSMLKVAWRCRLDGQPDGSKLLMPVRPVAILGGMLEVEVQNVSLMWSCRATVRFNRWSRHGHLSFVTRVPWNMKQVSKN